MTRDRLWIVFRSRSDLLCPRYLYAQRGASAGCSFSVPRSVSACGTTNFLCCELQNAVGQITGFLEIDRNDRKYAPVSERADESSRSSSCPAIRGNATSTRPRAHELRHPLLSRHRLGRAGHIRLPVNNQIPTSTISSIRAIGRRPRERCTPPITFLSPRVASVRHRAKPPAR